MVLHFAHLYVLYVLLLVLYTYSHTHILLFWNMFSEFFHQIIFHRFLMRDNTLLETCSTTFCNMFFFSFRFVVLFILFTNQVNEVRCDSADITYPVLCTRCVCEKWSGVFESLFRYGPNTTQLNLLILLLFDFVSF